MYAAPARPTRGVIDACAQVGKGRVLYDDNGQRWQRCAARQAIPMSLTQG